MSTTSKMHQILAGNLTGTLPLSLCPISVPAVETTLLLLKGKGLAFLTSWANKICRNECGQFSLDAAIFSFGEHRTGRDLLACLFQSPFYFQLPSCPIHSIALLWVIVGGEFYSVLWSTRALAEGCLSLCGPSVKWEQAHISPAASVNTWQDKNTKFENSCFFYTLLRRLPDACFCCAENQGQ